MTMEETQVVIAGGGPVGMTLALELASHGIRSILAERRATTTSHPKMDLTNGRSMELFRRLGMADKLRAVGVPEDRTLDILWATSAAGHPLHRFPYAPRTQLRAEIRARNDGTDLLEPGMRISQIIVEPVLKKSIEENPLIDVRFGYAFEALEQHADSVVVQLRNTATDAIQSVRCKYLAGCDGGGSTVRTRLGIQMEGAHNIARVLMVHFKSTAVDVLGKWGIAYHLQTGMGSLIAQDDRETWTLHSVLAPGTDESALDPAAVLRAFAGRDFDFEILVSNPWSPHQVVAQKYVAGRVVLAGDAAHQFIPSGGYGMNTGIGDAVDVGWKLAAVLNGWGGPGLIASYEQERRPVAIRNREAAQRHFGIRRKIAGQYAAAKAEGPLDEQSEAGAARRAKLGAVIGDLGNAENECWGIEYGYRYDGSAIVCAGEESLPPLDPLVYSPIPVPGARLPHLFLEDGSALFDHLGREFTLLSIGAVSAGEFAKSAETLSMPLKVLRLKDASAQRILGNRLILVRPDHHIAWLGPDAPADCMRILKRVTAAGWELAQRVFRN
jgi:2-polyprenyl-6-methoxyphenol hydroxylase-like FAD-dependent oxidoreductase